MYTGSSVVPTAAQPPRAIESAAPPQTAATAEPAPVTPLAIRVEQEMPGLKVFPAVAPGAGEPTVPELSAPIPPRSGGFRVTSPIELHVLDGERLLGSSRDGPIIAGAGRREFDFVNSVIGYRVRREVDVKPGQITAVSVTISNGRLNINATPWASVWIDGSPYGETPLGNLSIVPGEHEIVFRHPQLGERRERTLVRPDTTARVAVNLQRIKTRSRDQGKRARRVRPVGVARPPLGSMVTAAPTTRPGTLGGASTTSVARPASSGTNSPAPTDSVLVTSQS